jgi:hypothetical protein
MCLSAMMMGGMGGGGGNFFAPVPQGSRVKSMQSVMWIVLMAHLGLAIALIVIVGWGGVMELLT